MMGKEPTYYDIFCDIRNQSDKLEKMFETLESKNQALEHELDLLNKKYDQLKLWANKICQLCCVDDYSRFNEVGRIIMVQVHVSEIALRLSVDKGKMISHLYDRLKEQMSIVVREGRFD